MIDDLRAQCEAMVDRMLGTRTSIGEHLYEVAVESMKAFARERRQAERERCAKIATDSLITMQATDFDRGYITAIDGARRAVAKAIRGEEGG